MTPWLRKNAAVLGIAIAIVGSSSGVVWTLGARDADLDHVIEQLQRIEGWAQVVEARQNDTLKAEAEARTVAAAARSELRSSILVLQALYARLRADVDRIMVVLRIRDE